MGRSWQSIALVLIFFLLALNVWVFVANGSSEEPEVREASLSAVEQPDVVNEVEEEVPPSPYLELFHNFHLVDIQETDPSIQVDLRYGTTNNFVQENMYEGLRTAWLHPLAAEKLSKAQEFLKEKHPKWSLLVWDAARPVDVQKKMWEKVKGTSEQQYVASPNHGSLHSYGMAVDVTIADADGQPLDMGTDFDHFSELAQPRFHQKLLTEGKLTNQQIDHRKLLKKVMRQAGFRSIQTEWWHFNALSLKEVKHRYSILE